MEASPEHSKMPASFPIIPFGFRAAAFFADIGLQILTKIHPEMFLEERPIVLFCSKFASATRCTERPRAIAIPLGNASSSKAQQPWSNRANYKSFAYEIQLSFSEMF